MVLLMPNEINVGFIVAFVVIGDIAGFDDIFDALLQKHSYLKIWQNAIIYCIGTSIIMEVIP